MVNSNVCVGENPMYIHELYFLCMIKLRLYHIDNYVIKSIILKCGGNKYLISLLQLNMVCKVFFLRGAKVVVILIVQIKMRRRLWSLIEFLLLSSTRMFPTRELVFVSTQPQCPHLKYAYEKHVYFTN